MIAVSGVPAAANPTQSVVFPGPLATFTARATPSATTALVEPLTMIDAAGGGGGGGGGDAAGVNRISILLHKNRDIADGVCPSPRSPKDEPIAGVHGRDSQGQALVDPGGPISIDGPGMDRGPCRRQRAARRLDNSNRGRSPVGDFRHPDHGFDGHGAVRDEYRGTIGVEVGGPGDALGQHVEARPCRSDCARGSRRTSWPCRSRSALRPRKADRSLRAPWARGTRRAGWPSGAVCPRCPDRTLWPRWSGRPLWAG